MFVLLVGQRLQKGDEGIFLFIGQAKVAEFVDVLGRVDFPFFPR